MDNDFKFPDITVHVTKTYEIHLSEKHMSRLVMMLNRYRKDILEKLPTPPDEESLLITAFHDAWMYRS